MYKSTIPYRVAPKVQKHNLIGGPETFNAINSSLGGVELLLIEQARHLRWEHGMKVVDIQARLGQTRHWVITNTKRVEA